MLTWIASVYTVRVIMFPRDSASVYIVTILLSMFPRTSCVQPAGNFTSFAAEMSLSCNCPEFQDTVIKASPSKRPRMAGTRSIGVQPTAVARRRMACGGRGLCRLDVLPNMLQPTSMATHY